MQKKTRNNLVLLYMISVLINVTALNFSNLDEGLIASLGLYLYVASLVTSLLFPFSLFSFIYLSYLWRCGYVKRKEMELLNIENCSG